MWSNRDSHSFLVGIENVTNSRRRFDDFLENQADSYPTIQQLHSLVFIQRSPQLQFSSVQSLSRVRLFATPRITARQASLSITNSPSLLRLMPTESVMPSSHLILCRPLLLLPPIPSSIQRVNSSHEVARVLEFQLQHHNL